MKERTGRFGRLVAVSVVVGLLLSLTSCGGGGGGGSIGGTGGGPTGGIHFSATVTSPSGTRTFSANAINVSLGIEYIEIAAGRVDDIVVGLRFVRPSQTPAIATLDRDTWYNFQQGGWVELSTKEYFITWGEGASGTIRVNSLTDNRIAGTFQMTAVSPNTGTVILVSGSFDLPKGTWSFVNGQWVGGP